MKEEKNKEIKTTLKKNQTADIPTKSGGKYSYQYVDIAQIHEYLEENKMSYYQYIERVGDDDYIMTVPIINGEEKSPRRGSRIVQATLMGNNNPAQEQGSALTYARRYSLLMAFGLATEDDDANSLNKTIEPAEITLEEALNLVANIGKYKGKNKKWFEIYQKDYNWLEYISTGETPNQTAKKCLELFEEMPASKLKKLVEECDTTIETLLTKCNVKNVYELTDEQIKNATETMLEFKKKKEQAKNKTENLLTNSMLEEAEQMVEGR